MTMVAAMPMPMKARMVIAQNRRSSSDTTPALTCPKA
jgi:hypothetical protein